MPFKYDSTGAVVLADHNGKKLPVFINAKGEEAPFDADSTVDTIARLNREAQAHREGKEATEGKLKVFDGLDPVKAREALETLAKLDAKKLIDAGEVDRVKAEIANGFTTQLSEMKTANEALQDRIYNMTIGGAFAGSELIKTKFAIPVDFVRARFGENFGIENDRVYGVDASGNKIYSKTKLGELADFDEALEFLVNAHPQKDVLLKGTGASGTGSQQSGQGAGGRRTVPRAIWQTYSPDEQAKAGKDYTLVD